MNECLTQADVSLRGHLLPTENPNIWRGEGLIKFTDAGVLFCCQNWWRLRRSRFEGEEWDIQSGCALDTARGGDLGPKM